MAVTGITRDTTLSYSDNDLDLIIQIKLKIKEHYINITYTND